ncbi:MAG: rhodanese-like domain-containing protein [Candidatus Uhrbacteria bacterium]
MKTITVQELKERLENPAPGKSILIDVRSPDEYAEGHIPSAINRPIGGLAIYEEALRAYDHVYVHCLTGGRSGRVCARLSEIGLPDASSVEGGVTAWAAAGYPVER